MRSILTATALVLATVVIPVGNAQAVPTCFGREATILGTNGDDSLYKDGSSPDVFVALQGDDSMDWEDYSGRDYMCGGSGDDWFASDNRDDRLDGAGGRDEMLSGEDADKAFGGGGNDTIYNSLPPGSGWGPSSDGALDVLDGGDGTDTCYAEAIDIVRNCEVIVHVP